MENTNKGYIYLLQLCDEKKQTVYKIGKAEEIKSRLQSYNLKTFYFIFL